MTGIDDLSDRQLERFSRHLSLTGFGPEAQLKLIDSHVLVVGAGGLGSPVLPYLAAAGVGHVTVVDDDVVDRSNLHRQVIHSEADIGRPKTESAAAVMHGLNPDMRVTQVRERIAPDNALALLEGVDVVVDGSDNFRTRYVLSDATEISGKPLVHGAILRFDGQVSVFWAGHGPTYRDLHPEPPEAGAVPSCAEAGVIGVLPGVIGSIMATETIKLLTGLGRPLLGRVLVYDALDASFRELTLRPDPARPAVTDVAADLGDDSACTVQPPVAEDEVSVAQLHALLDAGGDLVLLDVREPWEHRLGTIPGAINLPLAQVEGGSLPIPAIDEDPQRRVVLYCKAGVRSRKAMQSLLMRYPSRELRSLAGGFDAWTAGR